MANCKACGRWFASTDPTDEICYPCNQALKRLNGYAVPVVRCKDCKHYKPQEQSAKWNGTVNYCTRSVSIKMQPGGFCSYGERRTE